MPSRCYKCGQEMDDGKGLGVTDEEINQMVSHATAQVVDAIARSDSLDITKAHLLDDCVPNFMSTMGDWLREHLATKALKDIPALTIVAISRKSGAVVALNPAEKDWIPEGMPEIKTKEDAQVAWAMLAHAIDKVEPEMILKAALYRLGKKNTAAMRDVFSKMRLHKPILVALAWSDCEQDLEKIVENGEEAVPFTTCGLVMCTLLIDDNKPTVH